MNSKAIPPYVVDMHSIDHERLLIALGDIDVFLPSKTEEKWYSLVHMLPAGLQSALRSELEMGNKILSIQFANWPHTGSVAVSLGAPFRNDFSNGRFGVCYRVLNDPHYWQAGIHQTVDGVEHLIIV